MEYRRKPDYADNAYREAVSRLRILLAESYTPIRKPLRELDSAGEETDNQSLMSAGSRTSRYGRTYYPSYYTPIAPKRYYYPHMKSSGNLLPSEVDKNLPDPPKFENTSAPPELMSFIERQEDYIEQLEKESRFCRGELSSLLSKVKDVISENENLHEKQKNTLIKSVFDQLETETETETETELTKTMKSPKKSKKIKILEGPPIVFESRISELEAQLTQAKIDLKKAQDDNDAYKRKISDGSILDGVGFEAYKKQIDNLQRDKLDLQNSVSKLESLLSKLKDKENDTCGQVKRSIDAAEQAHYEKNAADLEIRRLKDELERQHSKLRDAIADQSRRISDERSAVERRYTQQIEQLTTELGVQWETTNKLQLESDKQRRENGDLRRECAQKQALIDELKKDMQSKIITLQSDIGVSGAEKSALEQQMGSLQMANERNERHYKQEIARLQAEMQSLRQRSDRADADLIHSRRENIRLTEQVASLDKEIKLNAALTDERSKRPGSSNEIVALPPPTSKQEDRDNELGTMIHDLESKHAATVAELEGMIKSQNQLMDKLSVECHALTTKLEDASNRHKEEIRELQTNLGHLNNRISQSQFTSSDPKDQNGHSFSNQRSIQKPNTEHLAQRNLSRTSSNASIKPGNSPLKDIIPEQIEQPLQNRNSQPIIKDQEFPIQPNVTTQPDNNYTHQSEQQDPTNQPHLYQSEVKTQDPQYIPESEITSNVPEYPPQSEYYADQQYATDPDQKYVTNPTDQQYDQYTADPNQYDQQYLTQEQYDQQYGADPDQQYRADHDQQYVVDPAQQYGTDPNQQYDPNYGYAKNPNEPIQYGMEGYNTEPNQPYDVSDPSAQDYPDPNQPIGVGLQEKIDDGDPIQNST